MSLTTATPAIASLSSYSSLSHLPSSLLADLSELSSAQTQIEAALDNLSQCVTISGITQQSATIKKMIQQTKHHIQQLRDTYINNANNNDNEPSTSSAQQQQTDSKHQAYQIQKYAQQQLDKHAAVVENYLNLMRQRLLLCRANMNKHDANIRQQLIAAPSTSSASSTSVSDQQRQFTSSLSSTHTLLSDSLSMSAASLASLASSTQTLQRTQHQSSVYTHTLKGGHNIISKQLQRKKTDRYLIMLGLCFFCLVCVYIINKRLRISKIIGFVTQLIWGSGSAVMSLADSGHGNEAMVAYDVDQHSHSHTDL